MINLHGKCDICGRPAEDGHEHGGEMKDFEEWWRKEGSVKYAEMMDNSESMIKIIEMIFTSGSLLDKAIEGIEDIHPYASGSNESTSMQEAAIQVLRNMKGG